MKTVLRLFGVIYLGLFMCLTVFGQEHSDPIAAEAENAEKVYFSPEVESLFVRGVSLVQGENFKQGLKLFDRIIELIPRHPVGYFLKAATYEDIQQNYRTKLFEDKFKYNLKLAKKYSQKMLKADKNDPVGNFFLGGCYGYKGLHDKERGLWLSAFRNGLRGVGLMEKTIEIDPTFYDCYFGIGAYHYWRVEKGRLFKFLGFFEDTRQQGIDELELAAKNGRYASFESYSALIRIFLHEKRYEDVLEVIAQVQKKVPNDVHMLWFKSYVFIEQKRWSEALEVLRLLEKALDNRPFTSKNAFAECYYYQAVCLVELGEHELAKVKVDWIQSNWRRLRRTETINMVLKGIRKFDL